MNKIISLKNFNFSYDESRTPAITNQDNDTVLFLNDDYSDVILKIEINNGQLSMIPTKNIDVQNIKITRISDFEYEIKPI